MGTERRVDRFARWLEVSAPEAGGLVSAQGVGSNDDDASEEDREGKEEVENCALPGFGSVAESGDLLLTIPRDHGGFAVAALTSRPSGSQGGDRFVTHKSGGVLRMRSSSGATELEAKACKAINGIILGSDSLTPGGDGVPGPHYAARGSDLVQLDGITVGSVIATSVHVKIG